MPVGFKELLLKPGCFVFACCFADLSVEELDLLQLVVLLCLISLLYELPGGSGYPGFVGSGLDSFYTLCCGVLQCLVNGLPVEVYCGLCRRLGVKSGRSVWIW